MPLDQFLSGGSLPWLNPGKPDSNRDLMTGANLASSFMENSMRQQEMQQKAQMNPIAIQIAKDDEQIKQLQIAQGAFMQKERVDRETAATAGAALLATLPDQEGGAANYPATLDKVLKGVGKFGNAFFESEPTQLALKGSEQAYKTKNALENHLQALDVQKQRAATAEESVQNLKTAKEAADARLRDKEAGWEKVQADHDATKLQVKALELHEKLTNGDGKDGIVQIERRALMGQISALNSAIRDKTITLEDGTRKMQTLERQYSEKAKSRLNIPAESTAPAATPQTFQNGEVRRQNGKTYQFDGSKWNPIP